jgi:hypothetical protein
MKMKGEARIAGAGSTEDVPACFSFGIVFFINAAIWRKTTMEFFNQAITVLQTLVVAIGAGLGVWGVVNLMEGYGNDNPGANAHVRQRSTKQNKDSQPCHYSEVRGTQ